MPDIRVSPAAWIVEKLKEFGEVVHGYNPMLEREEIEGFGVRAFEDLELGSVIVAVAQ